MEKRSRDWRLKKKFLLRIIAGTGVIMMIANTASSASTFKLKQPTHYFADHKTLALLQAAMAGDLPKARQLVAEGANPNAEGPVNNPYNRLRLLHYTIAADNRDAVKVLVAVGADPEARVKGCGRAFLFAMRLKNMGMLSLLLDLRPISILSKDTLQNILFNAVRDNCLSCLELFLGRGAPIDYPDGSGYTMMMRAMDAQNYDLAEWLLMRGASVHIEPASGVTPAYSVQYDLERFRPGTPTHNKVQRLKNLMAERGSVFPAPAPEEVRALRSKH